MPKLSWSLNSELCILQKLQSIPSIKPCERVSMFRRLGFVSFSFGFRFVWVSFRFRSMTN